MSLDATLRKGGAHMVTVRTPHHLRADQIARIFAHDRAVYGMEDNYTRATAEKRIRTHLYEHGLEYLGSTWSEQVDDADEIRQWAREQIERLFPKMLPELSEDF